MDESNLLPPNAIDATSSRLLSDARLDNPDAWKTLTFVYGPVVRFWISRAGISSKADIADISQEVFVAVSVNLKKFHRQEGHAKFRAWLKTIALSKVSDHFRRHGKQPQAAGGTMAAFELEQIASFDPSSVDLDATGPAGDVDESEQSLLTQQVLELIRAEFRDSTWQAFWRTAVDGRNATEIAEELGVSPAAIRKAKSRILSRLREAMSEFGLE